MPIPQPSGTERHVLRPRPDPVCVCACLGPKRRGRGAQRVMSACTLVAPGAHGGSLFFRSYLARERGGTWARDVPCPEEAGRRAGPSVLALSLVTPRKG